FLDTAVWTVFQTSSRSMGWIRDAHVMPSVLQNSSGQYPVIHLHPSLMYCMVQSASFLQRNTMPGRFSTNVLSFRSPSNKRKAPFSSLEFSCFMLEGCC